MQALPEVPEGQVPEYRIIDPQGWFAAPDLIPFDSIVRTWAPPGAHFEPLNAAAIVAMEDWYEEEYPAANKKGEPLYNPDGSAKMWKPHAQHRIRTYAKTDTATVELIAPPSKDTRPILSLAELQKGPKATDQRPPPVHSRPARSSLNTSAEIAKDADDIELPPAQVIKAGAPPSNAPARAAR
jgi:hypothetical protein